MCLLSTHDIFDYEPHDDLSHCNDYDQLNFIQLDVYFIQLKQYFFVNPIIIFNFAKQIQEYGKRYDCKRKELLRLSL